MHAVYYAPHPALEFRRVGVYRWRWTAHLVAWACETFRDGTLWPSAVVREERGAR